MTRQANPGDCLRGGTRSSGQRSPSPWGQAGIALALTLLCAGAKEKEVWPAPALLLLLEHGEVAGNASRLPGWDIRMP